MSYAVITWADSDNNNYKVRIPGISEDFTFPAQHITYRDLRIGQTVELIDINNWPPYKASQIGNLRVRERENLPSLARWFPASEMKAASHLSNLAYGFIYSSERNPRWQLECPLYRKGIVQTIHDGVYMTVAVELGGFTPDTRCATEYYSCGTGVFAVGDNVVVKFKNNALTQPTVIGFWDDPEDCVFENWSGGQVQELCYNRRWDFNQWFPGASSYTNQSCDSSGMGYYIDGSEELSLHVYGRPQVGFQVMTLGFLAWYAQNPVSLAWEYDRTYPGEAYLEFRFPTLYFWDSDVGRPDSYVQLTILKWDPETEQGGDEWTDFVILAHEDATQEAVDFWGNDVRELYDIDGVWKLDLRDYGWEKGDRIAGVTIDFEVAPDEHLFYNCDYIDIYPIEVSSSSSSSSKSSSSLSLSSSSSFSSA